MMMFHFNKVKVHLAPHDMGFLIEYMAKISNPEGQHKPWTPGKLLAYFIKQQHWSPLQMINVVLEAETTRDISHQLIRHDFKFHDFDLQEFSQRYAEVLNDMVFRDARRQDHANRQNSIDDMSQEDKDWWYKQQCDIENLILPIYKESLRRGIAKEVARVVLPEGMTTTKMYINGNVRTWYHYCQLRMGNGTQLEHIDFANKCNIALHSLLPEVFLLDQPELALD
jgi:thymidylate synthase (FAD)